MAKSAPHVRYPNQYVWFVFVSALDLMLTWVILYFGGREVNGVASHILHQYGIVGMVIFKFALVVLVVVLCEWIGRHNDRAGRRVASLAIVVTCLPVLLSFFLLIAHPR
ncbi:MAG TPA: DUF5658 family protein [Tepidisphaeraceae bacterium]|jgi:hypothetical protein|nr:DUF5658 family protein [Tepidisphaeraceae bacterium]